FAVELAKIFSPTVYVQPFEGFVKPDFPSGKGRDAFTLERDLLDGVFGDDVALRAAALDGNFCEIDVELQFPKLGMGLQLYVYHFGLAVGIGREIEYPRSFAAFGEVVFFIARNA